MAMYPAPYITEEGAECVWAAQELSHTEALRVANAWEGRPISTCVKDYIRNDKVYWEVMLIIRVED